MRNLDQTAITYRPDIDGLRALAVLLVVAFHAFPNKLPGGFIGVDVFFVISGYLITSIILKELQAEKFTFKKFYIRRINRIYPVLLVVLFSFFALGWFALLADELKSFGEYMAAAGLFSSNILLWKNIGYFDTASELKPLLHLWSLGVEEQFYLIWPLLLWFAYKKRVPILLLALLLFFTSYGLSVYTVKTSPSGAFYLPHTRFFELLMGSILAYFSTFGSLTDLPLRGLTARANPFMRVLPHSLSLLGILCIALAVYQLNQTKPFPGNNALLPIIGAALLIAANKNSLINRYVLANRFMVWVGLWSFSIYLWHWPLLSFARIIEQGMPSKTIRIICVGLSFLLAIATYYWVEKPARYGKNPGLRACLMLFISLSFAGLGFYTYQVQGFSDRAFLARLNKAPKFGGIAPHAVQKRAEMAAGLGISSHPGAHKVLILGDSHAHHLLSGFFKVYPNTPITVISGPGCPLLLGIDRAEKQTPCQILTEQTFLPQHLASVETIIFSFRMFAYNRSGFEYNIEKQDWGLWYKSQHLALDDLSFWQPALRETLEYLRQMKKRVIITYDVPELFNHMNDCIDIRPLYLTKKTAKSCNMPRAEVDKRQMAVRKLFTEVLSEFPEVQVFDPLKLFCDKQWCYAIKKGVPLYYDDDHLSMAGSLLYATAFAKQFPSLQQDNI